MREFSIEELLCAMAGVCIAAGAGVVLWLGLLAVATLAGAV